MAVVIDATVGGVNSNSYITRNEADSYNEAHVSGASWAAQTDANKDIAIVMATRVLDAEIDWEGYKAEEDQALRWPRNGTYDKDNWYIDNDVIPLDLKNAVSEFARLLLEEDRTAESDSKGLRSLSVGSIDLEFDKHDESPVIADSVYAMISHLGKRNSPSSGVQQVNLVRV